MAQTWGDTIYRGYTAGRAIGSDIAGARFNRRAARVRDEYQQRAESEGKQLEDYLPEMEERLRQTAIDVGATRRGLSPEGGAIETLRSHVGTAGDRRAGALSLEGNQAGARDSRARTQYAIGSFDNGQGQQIAGDTIRATSGAMRPDGTYDMAAGAQALAGVGARYGDAGQANAQQQAATTFRLQDARAKADSLFNMVQNVQAFSPDQIAGAWEGFKASVPEMQNIDVRKGPDNKLYLYTDGKATGSFDPANETDVQELATMMSQFTQEPGAALQQFTQARLASIAAEKERDSNIEGKVLDAQLDVVKKLVDSGAPPDVADALVRAQRSLSGSGSSGGGWQLQDLGEEPGTYLMQKGGNVYVVKTNQAADPTTGFDGGPVQVFEADGVTPVDPRVLNRGEAQTLTASLAELDMAQRRAGYQLRSESVRDALNVLNEIGSQMRGLGRGAQPRAGLGGGRRFPIKETDDYVRNILGNVGQVPEGSPREKARFLMEALVQQESGGDHSAVSPKGALGVTQVMPQTGKDPGFGVQPLRNNSREEYMRFGEDYLTAMLERYNGDPELALAAYNAGPARADAWAKRDGMEPAGGRAGAISPTTRQGPSFAGVEGGVRTRALTPLPAQNPARQSAAAQLQEAEAQLARFDADFSTRTTARPSALGITGGAFGMQARTGTNLTASQRQARQQLEQRVIELRQTAADEQRTNTRIANLEQREAQNREAAELARQYGGAADFLSRAAQAP